MKKIKTLLSVLSLLSITEVYHAQESTYFYYYKGEKYVLELDRSTISVSSKTDGMNGYRVKSKATEDFTRNAVISLDQNARKNKKIKTFYSELETGSIKNDEEYTSYLQKLNNDPDILIASPAFKTHQGEKIGLSNNFYVKLKSKDDVKKIYDFAEKNHVEVLGYNQYMPLWFTISCSKNSKYNALELANIFYETGWFESTEPAFVLHDLLSSSDPYFNNQWGLKNTGQYGSAYAGTDIKAEQAWTIATGTNIKTAIFDGGFEMNHPDLANNVFGTGYDAHTNTSPAQIYGEHGTGCAGIVGAVQNNNLGVSGVAPNAKLVSISIKHGSSTWQNFANGFSWAAQNGIDVISNSWSGGTPSSILDNAISDALTYGRGGKGCVIVFSTGNTDSEPVLYPTNSNPKIIAVGAMSPCGERKTPTSCDGEIKWGGTYGTQLDVIAPGVKVPTTDLQGAVGKDPSDYNQNFNGTSASCPIVAGVATLILSKNPDLTNQQVNDIIEKSAQKVRTDLYSYTTTSGRTNGTWNKEMGYGLVNAYQALLNTPSPISCTPSLTISVPVTGTDLQQASSSIIATNTINSGTTAVYHAGKEILLSDGFTSLTGSVFRAHLEGCTNNYIAKTTNNKEIITYNQSSIDEGINPIADIIDIYPNPNNGIFIIEPQKSISQYNIDILALDGKTIYHSESKGVRHQIDISNSPVGIYLIVISTKDGKTYTQKIIKK